MYKSIFSIRTIYGRQLVKIPTPRFFVFYNGRDMQPERQVLKLSDAFMNPEEDPALELKVVMLNIYLGRNKELMEQCHTLLEYAQFVDRLRTCEKNMGREEEFAPEYDWKKVMEKTGAYVEKKC